MSDLLEFRHFKYLIAVAEEKNISRAAKRLFLAQPSLSIQLKCIEDALSIELLVRAKGGKTDSGSGSADCRSPADTCTS